MVLRGVAAVEPQSMTGSAPVLGHLILPLFLTMAVGYEHR